jgi:nucleotide-binding universal stress UspA family protein
MIMPYMGSIVYATAETPVSRVKVTMGKMAKTASDYLCKVSEKLEGQGFCVTASVLYGNPAEQIVNYVNKEKADLIVMASTGKSTISRWNMSHIAGKVIKETQVPVLLVKPGPDFKETKARRKGVAT